MNTHDPLCPAERSNWDDGHHFASPGECCCDLIVLVAAREKARALEFCCEDTEKELREKIAAEIETQPIDAWGSQAPRGPVSFARWEAIRRSADIARGKKNE